MKHDYIIEDFGVRLRPVEVSDCGYIHNLRRMNGLSAFIGDTDPDISKQVDWMRQYFDREGDYYFLVELVHGNVPVGTISLYDEKMGRAEWGRWIIAPPYQLAPVTVWLIYQFAFKVLDLQEVYCRTVKDNVKVVSFHDHCGLKRIGEIANGVTINKIPRDLIVHSCTQDMFESVKQNMHTSVIVSGRLYGGK